MLSFPSSYCGTQLGKNLPHKWHTLCVTQKVTPIILMVHDVCHIQGHAESRGKLFFCCWDCLFSVWTLRELPKVSRVGCLRALAQWLDDTKSLRVLDGQDQLVLHDLSGGVLGQVQQVEAGMGHRQILLPTPCGLDDHLETSEHMHRRWPFSTTRETSLFFPSSLSHSARLEKVASFFFFSLSLFVFSGSAIRTKWLELSKSCLPSKNLSWQNWEEMMHWDYLHHFVS